MTATTPKAPHTVNDYTVLSLAVQPTKAFPLPSLHYLYLRQHTPKLPTPTSDSELFLVNLPVDSTAATLRALFSSAIDNTFISNITFPETAPATTSTPSSSASRKRKRGPAQDTDLTTPSHPWPIPPERSIHQSGTTCLLTFPDPPSATSFLKAAQRLSRAPSSGALSWPPATKKPPPPLGSARYRARHASAFPAADVLQAGVDAYMAEFNSAAARAAREAAARDAGPDEDGFVTVTRAGGGARRVEPMEKEGGEDAGEGKNKKRGRGTAVVEDFYRFQMRERRRKEEGELRRGFEEARRRVGGMREARRRSGGARGGSGGGRGGRGRGRGT